MAKTLTEAEVKAIGNRLYGAFRGAGVPDVNARILVAQSQHETANFTSDVMWYNNNIAGLKVPSVRSTPYVAGAGSAAPSAEGATPYARYNSLEDSAKDLVNLLQYRGVNWNHVSTVGAYASWLGSWGYYGEGGLPVYIAGLTRYLDIQAAQGWKFTSTLVSRNKKSLVVGVALIAGAVLLYLHTQKKL